MAQLVTDGHALVASESLVAGSDGKMEQPTVSVKQLHSLMAKAGFEDIDDDWAAQAFLLGSTKPAETDGQEQTTQAKGRNTGRQRRNLQGTGNGSSAITSGHQGQPKGGMVHTPKT